MSSKGEGVRHSGSASGNQGTLARFQHPASRFQHPASGVDLLAAGFEPRETSDARLVDTLVKGWAQKGPGIDASETLAGLLTEHTIAEESVTWALGPDEPEMLKRTVEHLATLALGEGAWVQRWARDWLAQVQAGMLEITLGFGDLLARPR